MEIFSTLLAHCARNSPVTGEYPYKGQWRWALTFSLICVWINDWVNDREAGDLTCHRAQYDVTVVVRLTRRYTGISIATGKPLTAALNIKTLSYNYINSHYKDKTDAGFIFIMEIHISGKTIFLLRWGADCVSTTELTWKYELKYSVKQKRHFLDQFCHYHAISILPYKTGL